MEIKWFEFKKTDPHKMRNTAIDRSDLLDAPAGKHGFIKAEKEHFYFEDGTKARFLGTNIVAEANFLSHEETDMMLDRIAMAGYNLVRIHHLDAVWSNPNIFGENANSTLTLDSEMLDRIDYLFWQAKKRGIYLYVDGLVHRRLQKGEVSDEVFEGLDNGIKINGHFERETIQRQKEYLQQLFCHKNHYTGLSYAEDPALVMADIHNEDSMLWRPGLKWQITTDYYKNELREMFCAWLSKKYQSDDLLRKAWYEKDKNGLDEKETIFNNQVMLPNDFYEDDIHCFSSRRKSDTYEFLFDIQVNYYCEMNDYLKNELGLRCLICGSNVPESKDAADILANLSFEAGFLDRHRYYNHPLTTEYDIEDGYCCNMITEPMIGFTDDINIVSYFGRRCSFGVPFVQSEWNSCEPNFYSGADMVYMNAYAAMHNWNPVNFAFLQGKPRNENKIEFVFNTSDNPVKLALHAASAAMFLRGDVQEAKTGYAVKLSKQDVLNPDFAYDIPEGMPMVAKTGILWEGRKSETKLDSSLAEYVRNAGGHYVSITKELECDVNKKYFLINTPKSKGFAGFVNGICELSDLTLELENEYASVILSSLDNLPVEESGHMLLTAAAKCQNYGMRISKDGKEVINGGEKPVMIETVVGCVKLKTNKKYRIYILDCNGQRTEKKVTVKQKSGGVELLLLPENETIYYEFCEEDS